uniref:Uncharacterized protein LOC105051051 isoform X2 n=1 Tax=Elaeis guineensis var. tenera TaxID=51953 RepID=A0A6I9RWZ8_ELAGV|nr:uncharacterized protein LOC105051051 isoform X2 [Elaeis guineensis]
MGCTSSIPISYIVGRRRKKPSSIHEVAVFVPALRIPLAVDLVRPLRGLVSRDVLDKLSTLRGRIVCLAEETYLASVPTVSELQRALEEYVPVLLGLTKKGAKKVAVDLLLKAAGCLDYCVHHILVQLPMQIRKSLPSSLEEGMSEAISIQALAQSVEMQLGLALECEKATLSVKRRLACEAVSYFSQVLYCLAGCDLRDAYGKKLLLFIKWKYLEAKAAAYYYHGLVLDKGHGSSNHLNAVCCHFAAEELLTDSKKACLSFCLAAPVTRVPPAWGVMKHLRKKIPEVASKKSQMYGYLIEQDKNGAFQSLPDLPEFPLSLKPDDYELPNIDASWESEDCQPQIQSLKAHLKDEEDDETGTK